MNELFEEIYDLSMPENDDELIHYGVKGMQWGKRKEYVPVGRDKRVTVNGKGVYKTGSGLGTGSVGTGSVPKVQTTSKPKYSNPKAAQMRAAQVARYRKLTQQVSKRLNKTVSASKVESTIKEVVSEAVAQKKGSGGGSSKKKAAAAKTKAETAEKKSGGGGSGKKASAEKKSSEKKATEEKVVKEKAFKMTSQMKSTIKSLHSEMLTSIKQRNANFNAGESWFDEKDPESFTYWMGDLQSEFWDRIPDEMKKDDDFSEEAKEALKGLYDDLKKTFDKEEAAAQKKKEQAEAKAKKEKEAADKKAAAETAKKEKEAAQEKIKSEKEKAQKEAIAKAQETQRKRAEEDEKRKKAAAKARSLLHSYRFEITKKEYQVIPDPKGDYISHHGVQGQKWGVKNGPPYPLYRQGITRANYGKVMASKKNGGHKTTGNSGGFIFKKKINPKDIPKDTNITEYKRKEKQMTSAEDCKVINKSKDHTYNCTICSTAFDLRRRGFDVSVHNVESSKILEHYKKYSYMGEMAKTWITKDFKHPKTKFLPINKNVKFTDVTSTNEIKYEFGKWKPGRFTNEKALNDSFKKEPDGSRGLLSFMWYDTYIYTGQAYGHCINWEKENGKVRFYDCQAGREIPQSEMIEYAVANSMDYFRTDNCLLNNDKLADYRKRGGLK